MEFVRVSLTEVDWEALDRYPDRTFSQRKPWLDYLVRLGAGTPVVSCLYSDGREVGWFTGIRSSLAGLPILVSPRAGWNTAYMGINLLPGVSRTEALRALARFAFKQERCVYLELCDVSTEISCAEKAGYAVDRSIGYVSDLSLPEEKLFERMTSACRRCIRKAQREGIEIEEASPDGFAREFHAHLTDVFSHQGLRVPYSEERVRTVIECVHPSGNLLLLRARTKEGISIATGIFAGFGNYSSFWGNGSIRSMLHLRPNQALHWYAMRYWKQKGVRFHDWGGGGAYKEAYGPDRFFYVRLYKSVLPGIERLRRPALSLYKRMRESMNRTTTQ